MLMRCVRWRIGTFAIVGGLVDIVEDVDDRYGSMALGARAMEAGEVALGVEKLTAAMEFVEVAWRWATRLWRLPFIFAKISHFVRCAP